MQSKNNNIGKVLRISGTVIDVQFDQQHVPDISNKLEIICGNKNDTDNVICKNGDYSVPAAIIPFYKARAFFSQG